MNYQNISISKAMYKNGEAPFSQQLEALDPTADYQNTELAGLDAFQRQLKRFDIQVGGARSSRLEKFFQNAESAVLFPEYIMRAVRQGMEENSPLASLVAAKTFINSTDYRGLKTDAGTEAAVTAEKAALPTTTITLKDATTTLKKRGRLLSASYEALRFQRLDLFTIALSRMGADIVKGQVEDAVGVLMGGDGSTGSKPATLQTTGAGAITYADLIHLWSQFGAYQMNTLLVSPAMAAKILSIDNFAKPNGENFPVSGRLGTPLGAEMIVSTAVPANTVIALDRRYALEMVMGDEVTVDADRLIDTQLERAAVSSIAGFSMIFPDAVKVMTVKA